LKISVLLAGMLSPFLHQTMLATLIFTAIYARKDHTAESLADTFFLFFSTYGPYDVIFSDPGSDVTALAVKLLIEWFGITHVLSLVARPQTNGVEGTNSRIMRFLLTMITETPRIKKNWGAPHVHYFPPQ
jgi:transposase InsO family protein